MSTSEDYWREREAENLKHNLKTEEEYRKALNEQYDYMMDQIQKEINGFYAKYAKKEGITLTEAKKRVSELDMKEYERKAKKYVANRDFSDEANEEMRLYNATMKINRLELLKANIGLELVDGFDGLQKYFDGILTERTLEEFKRQAGILGETIQNNAERAKAIVNASFNNATFSDRIWMYQGMMKAELAQLLTSGLVQGKGSRELARHLSKLFGVSKTNAERLMVTELRRVQTEAARQSYIKNGVAEYTFLTANAKGPCDECRALDYKHFKVKDMKVGVNAPPMHPRCHCTTAPYEDEKDYQEWLDFLEKGGTTKEWNRLKMQNGNESVAKAGSGDIIKTERFNTADDPMREVLGKAEISHSEQLKQILSDMKSAGVAIQRRDGAMGYMPGVSFGSPGSIVMEEGASYSAWIHEYKHFCDDRSDGYLGFRVFQDTDKCIKREIDAYQKEIDLAQKYNRPDIVKRLEGLRDKEVKRYE